MNKRDKFWLNKLLSAAVVILLFTGLSLYNILQFNNFYMQEERGELTVFEKQIEWAIKPFLEKSDFVTAQKYCDDFVNEDIKFRIFDKNKNLVATTKKDNTEALLNIEPQKETNKLKEYRDSLKNKMIGMVKEIKTGNSTYYLEITISEEDVLKSIVHAQTSIWIFFASCFLFLLAGFVYVIRRIRKPFDRLENSVIKIANGELDTRIEVPDVDILEDLAAAVKKMTNRLKKQILRLKQLEEYKTEFISNVSHEIKTPITAINSAVELLESGNSITEAQDRECLNIIAFQVKFINTLVNDILSLAEIEADKTAEIKDFERLSAKNLIEKTVNYLSSPIPINFDGEEFETFGDESLLIRAFSNILTNAIKYSNSEKIDVRISSDGDFGIVELCDYGVGISEEHLPRIFERFYRVDKARSRKTGGTGLGLAIVKNIVELHNGKISVESEPDKGCKFTIILPLA